MKALIDGDGATGRASFASGEAREPSLDAPDPTFPSTPLPFIPPSPALHLTTTAWIKKMRIKKKIKIKMRKRKKRYVIHYLSIYIRFICTFLNRNL